MELQFSDLTLNKREYDPAAVIEPWVWRVEPGDSVLLPTALGHLFIERRDGSILFLNTWTGALDRVCDDYEEFKALLEGDEQFMRRWFLPEVVAGLLAGGLTRGPGECFCPFVSPGIGGSKAPENFQAVALRLHLITAAAERRAIVGDKPEARREAAEQGDEPVNAQES